MIVKQIKQKTGDNTFESYPIGAESLYVNMRSTLDLQEEFKFGGGAKKTIIQKLSANTIRVKQFFGERSAIDINNHPEKIKYTLFTDIYNSQTSGSSTEENTVISENVFTNSNNEHDEVVTLESYINDNIYQDIIIMSLYLGYQENIPDSESLKPIHQKVIIMAKNNTALESIL